MNEKGHIKRKACRGPLALTLYFAIAVLLCTEVPATAKVYLSVGILNEPKNLNPFQASDAWTMRILRLIYQPLYRIDQESMTLIPWLSEDQPLYDPQRKIVTFHLREMNWDDGTAFTAEDVVFTAQVFKRFRVPRHYAYWKFVKKIEAPDKRTVQITLERPMPILARRSLGSWIVQKRKWEATIRKADKRLDEVLATLKAKGKTEVERLDIAMKEALKIIQAHQVRRPTGLGPFKFEERKRGGYVLLLRNEHFFGKGKTIGGQELGPYIDRVIFKIYDTLSAAALGLRKGDIDFLWKGMSHALVEDLARAPNIKVLTTLDRGYRYLGFNLRKAPMSDGAFRRAIAYLIDKDFIVKRVLHNWGKRLDTVVPPTISFYFSPNTPAYGKGMDRDRRAREAYAILSSAGYGWKKPPLDAQGALRKGEGLIMPSGATLPPLSILTPPPEYDTEMAAAGRAIQGWLQDFGIQISWKPMAFGGLIQRIRNERDFDMFVLGWRNLSLDPDYLRRFFHSSHNRPGQWNDTGYRSTEFDKMADEQAKTIDLQERRRIVLALQSQLMTDLPYVPLYVPHRLEAVRTDPFEGWTTGVGGLGSAWALSLLKPTVWWHKPHRLHK